MEYVGESTMNVQQSLEQVVTSMCCVVLILDAAFCVAAG